MKTIVLMMLLTGSYADALQVKKLFYEAIHKPAVAEEMVNYFRKNKIHPTDERFAWFAAAEALTAKRASAPWTKVSISKSSLQKLQKAIDARPFDPFPYFLRMSVEKELPSFLGMSEHLDADRAKIASLLSGLLKSGDCKTVSEITQAMIGGGYCNKNNGSLFYNLNKQCSGN